MGAGHRTIAVPTRRHPRTLIFRLGSNRPKRLPTARTAGTSVSATATATNMPTAQGTPRALEIGQPGKAEAEKRSGDRQTGGQDNLGDPAVRGVVSRFPVLAGLTCLLIPPDEEYPVVGSSRDPDGYQQINGEGSETDNPVMAKERDDSPGHLQFYPDHQQQKNYGDNRTVDEKQHNEDHREAYRRDCDDRPVATVAHIRNDRRRAGDIGLDSRRRRRPRDDVLDGLRSIRSPRSGPGCRRGSIEHMRPYHRRFARRAAVSGSPQKFWMCCTCFGSSFN